MPVSFPFISEMQPDGHDTTGKPHTHTHSARTQVFGCNSRKLINIVIFCGTVKLLSKISSKFYLKSNAPVLLLLSFCPVLDSRAEVLTVTGRHCTFEHSPPHTHTTIYIAASASYSAPSCPTLNQINLRFKILCSSRALFIYLPSPPHPEPGFCSHLGGYEVCLTGAPICFPEHP